MTLCRVLPASCAGRTRVTSRERLEWMIRSPRTVVSRAGLTQRVTFFEGMVRVSASTSSTSGVWSNVAYVLWRWASGRPVNA